MFNIGDRFVGTVNRVEFRVTRIRAERPEIGLKIDYELSYTKSGNILTQHATEKLLSWLVRSGGLVKL